MKEDKDSYTITITVDREMYEKIKDFRHYKPNRLSSIPKTVTRMLRIFLYRRKTQSKELINIDNASL